MEDIQIVFKPIIDTKEINKEMQQIAQTSKTAIEQSYKSLDLTMRKSVEAWGGDISKVGKNLDLDTFVQKFKSQMQDLYQEINNTGNLPLGMSSKMLDSMQSVDRLIAKYRELTSVMDDMYNTFTSENEAQKSTIQSNLSQLKLQLDGYKEISKEAEKMVTDYKSYQSLLQDFSFTRGTKVYQGEDALQDYENRKRKIEETKARVEELRQAVSDGVIPEGKIKETNAEINKLEKSLRGLIVVQNQLNKESAENLIGMRESFAKSTNLPGLKEALGADNPMEALVSYATDAKITVDKLTEGIERETKALQDANNATVEQDANYSKIAQQVQETGVELIKAAAHTNELEQAAQKTTGSMSQMRNVVWSISRVLGNFYTIGLDMVRSAKQVANIYKKIWSYIMKVVNAFKKLREHIKKTNSEHAKSWAQMLKDVIRYSLGIRSLFMLFRRLRKYIKEAFEAMAEQIPEVNQTLSELKSSFNQVKASLATALEPVISALAAGLNRILSLLSQILTYVGMFFAAISGRGFVYKANKSMTSFADAAGGAADNVKELNKQLQGFDELNNLTTNENKDKGGGGAESPLANFEKTDIPKWIKDLANLVKSIWDAIVAPIKAAWDAVKDYVISSWKRAAKIVLGFFLDVVRDFLRAWAKWGYPIFVRIFQIVGDIGMIVENIAQALRDAWNANDNGYKIWSAILEIIYKVVDGIHNITQDMIKWTSTLNLTPAMTAFREWLESLIPIAETLMGVLYDIWDKVLKRWLTWTFDGENSGIARFFKILRDFNKKVNWKKLRENLQTIWNAIGKFGETVGEGLLMFIQGLSESLANWVNSKDFENTIDKIANFFNNIQPRDIKKDLDQVLRIIKNLAKAVWDVIKVVLDNKDKILNALEFASKHIKGLITLFLTFKSIIDLGRLISNIYLMLTAIQKLTGATTIVEGLKSAFGVLASSVGLATSAILIGVGLMIASIKSTFNQMDEEYDKFAGHIDTYNKINETLNQNIQDRANAMEDLDATSSVVHSLVAELDDLQSKTSLSADEQARQKQIIDELNSVLPDLNLAIDDQTGKLNMSTDAILRNADALIAQARVEAAKEDLVQIAKDQYEAEKNLYNQKQDLKSAEEEYQKVLKESRDLDAELAEYGLTGNDVRFMGAKKAVDDLKEGIAETEETINTLNEEYNRTTGYINEYLSQSESASQKQTEINKNIKDSTVDLSDSTSKVTTSINEMSDAVNNSMPNLDRLPSDVAEKMRQASTEAHSAFEATNEEIRATTQTALDNISEFQGMLDDETFDWKGWFEGNIDDLDFSTVESKMQEVGTSMKDALPTEEEWSELGTTIPTSISSGIDSNQTQAFDSMNNLASGMVDAFHDSALQFGSPSQTMINFGIDITNGLAQGINDNTEVAITTVSNFADAVVDRFTIMRNDIVEVFNGLITDVNTALNNFIDGVNTAFSNISMSINDLKGNMNSFTGSVNSSYNVNIPKLAQGAVIPPNNEFLAVLGDQKHGTNIESPLSTMVEAFNAANKGGNEQELALLQEQNDLLRQLLQKEFGISDNAIFDSVKRSNSQYRKQTGASAFA